MFSPMPCSWRNTSEFDAVTFTCSAPAVWRMEISMRPSMGGSRRIVACSLLRPICVCRRSPSASRSGSCHCWAGPLSLMVSPAGAAVAVLPIAPVKPRLGVAGAGVAAPRSPSRAAAGAATAVAGAPCCSSDSNGCAGALPLAGAAGLAAASGSRVSRPAGCAVACAVQGDCRWMQADVECRVGLRHVRLRCCLCLRLGGGARFGRGRVRWRQHRHRQADDGGGHGWQAAVGLWAVAIAVLGGRGRVSASAVSTPVTSSTCANRGRAEGAAPLLP